LNQKPIRAQAKDPDLILIRIQCRIDDELDVRRDGQMGQEVELVVKLRRVLVPQTGTAGLFRRAAPVEHETQHVDLLVHATTNPDADRTIQNGSGAAIRVTEPNEWDPYICKNVIERKRKSPAVRDPGVFTRVRLPSCQVNIIFKAIFPIGKPAGLSQTASISMQVSVPHAGSYITPPFITGKSSMRQSGILF